jgi:hypothetical protein
MSRVQMQVYPPPAVWNIRVCIATKDEWLFRRRNHRIAGILLVAACLLAFSMPSTAQTVVGSARVMCGVGHSWETSGPIAGAILNQTNTTISDLEVELSIIARDKKGTLKRERDTRFVVVPSLNQTGVVIKLEPSSDVYFSIPGKEPPGGDSTCPNGYAGGSAILNVATIAITRINGKSLLPLGKDGKPLKHAPLESMLQVPRETPEHVPTQGELIQEVREKNALLHSTIINNQLQDCLLRGTWACTFNNDTNINVVISQ